MGAVNADCAHFVNVLIISRLLIFSHILRGNAPFLTYFSYKN